MLNWISNLLEILKKKIFLNATKILIFCFAFITIFSISYAYSIQEYYETYIPQLIDANDRKELEIIRLQEKLKESLKISTEINVEEISVEENTLQKNLILGALALITLIVVGSTIYYFSCGGGSFDFSNDSFGVVKDTNISTSTSNTSVNMSTDQLALVNENFNKIKIETIKTRNLYAKLKTDIASNRDHFDICLEQLVKVSKDRQESIDNIVRANNSTLNIMNHIMRTLVDYKENSKQQTEILKEMFSNQKAENVYTSEMFDNMLSVLKSLKKK